MVYVISQNVNSLLDTAKLFFADNINVCLDTKDNATNTGTIMFDEKIAELYSKKNKRLIISHV